MTRRDLALFGTAAALAVVGVGAAAWLVADAVSGLVSALSALATLAVG